LFGENAAVYSRFAGAGVVGLCIGAMVALVEILFRKYWLEVSFGAGEMRLINLGDAPVSIGSDSKTCTVWTPNAPAVALTYVLRNNRLTCTDGTTGQAFDVLPGDRREAGSIVVLTRGEGAIEAPVLPMPRQGSGSSSDSPRMPWQAPEPIQKPMPRTESRPASAPPPRPAPGPGIYGSGPPRPQPAPPYSRGAAPQPVSAPAPQSMAQVPPQPGPGVGACPQCGYKVAGPVGRRYCIVCTEFF
jgi:hypothetical protein